MRAGSASKSGARRASSRTIRRPKDYKAVPEQAILFKVAAWDANCPQHIPQRFEAADVAAALADRDRRIEELQAEIARLRGESEGSRRGQ
jgi:predicted pyridoxine 5'-phosphate oxidase superfamily flavin-nucleotide-binding protein